MSTVVPFGQLHPNANDRAAVYTVREAAALLHLSIGSTYAAIRAGEIPSRRVGNRWIIPRRRFDDWLNSETAGAA